MGSDAGGQGSADDGVDFVGDFADADAELAAFGRQRLTSGVAYLATVRDERLPRVHPIQPIVSDHRLLVFMFELGIEEVLATEYDAGMPRYRR